MGLYCDKCKEMESKKNPVIEVRYLEIDTSSHKRDIKYLEKDPHLCIKCYEKFKAEIEKIIIDAFGHL